MSIQVTVGAATVSIGADEFRNRIEVLAQSYEVDNLLHACQRALDAAGEGNCEHVQSMLNDARKHIRTYAGKRCPVMTHFDVIADDLRSFAEELEKEEDTEHGRHKDYSEMLRNAATQLTRLSVQPDHGVVVTPGPITVQNPACTECPHPASSHRGSRCLECEGPSLDETSPALIDALRNLFHEYGAAGVEHTVRRMIAEHTVQMFPPVALDEYNAIRDQLRARGASTLLLETFDTMIPREAMRRMQLLTESADDFIADCSRLMGLLSGVTPPQAEPHQLQGATCGTCPHQSSSHVVTSCLECEQIRSAVASSTSETPQ